jgi:hypothetical protein
MYTYILIVILSNMPIVVLNNTLKLILAGFMIALFSTVLPSIMIQDAFAASPISSAVANDPDDGDTVYSVGDTIVITFPAATNATASGTMTNAEFQANFTVSNSDIDDDDTVSGVWTSQSILTITINAIADALNLDPVIDTDQISYRSGGTGTLFYEANDTAGGGGTEFLGTAVTLTGDFGVAADTAAATSGALTGCYDCIPPKLQHIQIKIDSDEKIIIPDDDPLHITANVGDKITVILNVTDNKSIDTIPFTGLYTNYQDKPNDMSLFYANHYNNLKEVSTSFYQWNLRSDDVAYDYDDTVSWSQTIPFVVTEDTTADNFIFKNDDHNTVEFFMIPFTMIANDSMQSTPITIVVTDSAGNSLYQTLPVTLEVVGDAPPEFDSNGKVLGFFNESVLSVMLSELNGSEDTAPLSALLGIPDESLPPWTLDLATWVAEDKIDSADLIVAVEYLIS